MKKKSLHYTSFLSAIMISAALLGGCSTNTDNQKELQTIQESTDTTLPSISESVTDSEIVSNFGQQDGLKYKVVDDQITITGYLETEEKASIEIPSEIDGKPVVGIGDNAFQTSKVAYVTLPDTITTIGNEAFQGCLELQEINLPEGIISIGTDAFRIMTNASGKYTLLKCIDQSYAQSYAVDNGLVYVTEEETSTNGNSLLARFTWKGEKANIEIREYQNEIGQSIEWQFDICDKNTGAIEQTVNMLPAESGDPHIKTMIKEKDVNFDGKNEILISKGHFGSSGVFYDTCLEWNEDSKTYIENETYSAIPNPEVLSSKKLIRSFIDSSNSEYHYYMYAYQDGNYNCIADLSFEGQNDGLVKVTEKKMQDGEMKVTQEKTGNDWNTALQEWAKDGYWDLSVNE